MTEVTADKQIIIDKMLHLIDVVLSHFKKLYERRTDCMEEILDNSMDISMAYKYYPREWISITDYGTPCRSLASYNLRDPQVTDFKTIEDFIFSARGAMEFIGTISVVSNVNYKVYSKLVWEIDGLIRALYSQEETE